MAWHYCSSFVSMWKSCEFSMQEWRTFTLVCIFKFSWPWLRSLDTKISIRNESDWTCELLSILGPIFWMLSLTNHDEHEAPQLACPTFFSQKILVLQLHLPCIPWPIIWMCRWLQDEALVIGMSCLKQCLSDMEVHVFNYGKHFMPLYLAHQ